MSSYLLIAAVAALLVLAGRAPFLRVLRALALPLAGLALAASAVALVAALHLEGSVWASAADVAFLTVLGYLAGRVFVLLVFDWVLVRRMGLPVPRLVRDILSLVIYVAIIATVLKLVLGLEVGALFATSAVITIILGLSLQQTLGNLLAGIAVAWEGRLRPGEWVRVGEVVGEVTEPGWRSVVLRTTLDERIAIPNSRLIEERFTLLGNGSEAVGVEVCLQVSYASPPDEVERVLLRVLGELPGVVAEPPPRVFTRDLADNGILYACRVWTARPWRDSELRSQLLTRAYAALTRAEMEIPFPQRTLRLVPRQQPADRMPVVRRALERCDLLSGLPAEALTMLAAASRLLRFAPGEPVVREGEGSTAMYAIVAGEAEVTQLRAERREVVGHLGTGHAFGEVAFLKGTPRLASVSATTSLEVVEIGEAALRDLLDSAPELAEELARRAARHERDASEAVSSGAGTTRTGRLAVSALLGDILRRFGRSS